MLWVYNHLEATMTTHELAHMLLTFDNLPVGVVTIDRAEGNETAEHVGVTDPQPEVWAHTSGSRRVMIASYTEER